MLLGNRFMMFPMMFPMIFPGGGLTFVTKKHACGNCGMNQA